MAEATLTRFIIFEPVDDTLLLWRIAGSVLANGRDQAGTMFYRDSSAPVTCAPVSENAWKPRKQIPKVVQQSRREPVAIPLADLPSSADPFAVTEAPLTDPDPDVENLDAPADDGEPVPPLETAGTDDRDLTDVASGAEVEA